MMQDNENVILLSKRWNTLIQMEEHYYAISPNCLPTKGSYFIYTTHNDQKLLMKCTEFTPLGVLASISSFCPSNLMVDYPMDFIVEEDRCSKVVYCTSNPSVGGVIPHMTINEIDVRYGYTVSGMIMSKQDHVVNNIVYSKIGSDIFEHNRLTVFENSLFMKRHIIELTKALKTQVDRNARLYEIYKPLSLSQSKKEKLTAKNLTANGNI